MNTWVFLRGLTRETRHWGDFPEIFRRAIPDAAVVALDLPGNGRLNGVTSPTRVEELAERARDELARLGVSRPCHLLAMSLGAMVAVEWAARHPREISGAVLINTSLAPFSPVFRRLKPANYPALLRLALFGASSCGWEETILRLTTRLVTTPDAVVAAWVACRNENPVSRDNALRQLLAAARYRAPRARPAPPLLLLASRRDALVDARCSRDLARRWHCALAEHPHAGHDLPLDDGPWVAARIREWLEHEAGAVSRCAPTGSFPLPADPARGL